MINMTVLQIETTTICNGHCKFCIHSTLPKFETMSDELFLKILNDAKEIPSIKAIVPMMLGEPLCDKKIISRLKLINKLLPDKIISLYTNCSLLTPSKVKKLSKIKNLSIRFSLNGVDTKSRKRTMGLDDFNHALKMIKLYKETNKPYEVIIIDHPSIHPEELERIESLGLNIKLISYKNWSGDKFSWTPQTNCFRAINTMTIMSNGFVNLCCMEHGKVIFGDVSKKSVKEIWESEARQLYCLKHLAGKYIRGPCFNCTKA